MDSFGKLHPTQERILRALADSQGKIPSLRQLGKIVGIASPNTIAHHLDQLQRKGYLAFHESGDFEVVWQPLKDIAYLPLYGNAACGTEEFFAEENVQDRIPLPTRTFKVGPDYFLVRARGDSMEPRIHDGDLLLAQPKSAIMEGTVMIVAAADGIYAKRVFTGASGLILQSYNPRYPPRVLADADQACPIGIVRGVLRSKIN
jgi:repressor LexA